MKDKNVHFLNSTGTKIYLNIWLLKNKKRYRNSVLYYINDFLYSLNEPKIRFQQCPVIHGRLEIYTKKIKVIELVRKYIFERPLY